MQQFALFYRTGPNDDWSRLDNESAFPEPAAKSIYHSYLNPAAIIAGHSQSNDGFEFRLQPVEG